jgi:phage gpG-like protein
VSLIRAEVEASVRSFQWNHAELHRLLAGADGPVSRDLAKRAIRVEGQAKVNASHSPPSVPGEGPAVRTGRLRGSITWRLGFDVAGPYADVGSAVLYAPYVELGTSRMEARPFLRPALDAARL